MIVAPLALCAAVVSALPQTFIRYELDAELVPETRTVSGRETIHWTNPSSSSIERVPVHLYLNAFAHSETTWMRGAGQPGVDVSTLLERWDDPWGWIELGTVAQRTGVRTATLSFAAIQPDDGNRLDRSLIELVLAEPIGPGETLVLELSFEARLPVPIARTGGSGDFFLVAQWFPKIGAFEVPGVRGATEPRWAAGQFHHVTEFYANFADWDVTLRAPQGWTIGATGEEISASVQGRRFVQRAVHDFAWVAGKALEERSETWTRSSSGSVALRYLAPSGHGATIDRAHDAVVHGLPLFESRIGPYPYDTLTVVLPPPEAEATSGMEYPTLITGLTTDPVFSSWPLEEARFVEAVVLHELAHQWFQGMLASNEQDEGFLDEGLATYWEGAALAARWPEESALGLAASRPLSAWALRQLGLALVAPRIREPISRRPSYLYAPGTALSQLYPRTASCFSTLEERFGAEVITKFFQAYYREFAFRHPRTEDLLGIAALASGPAPAAFLRECLEQPTVPNYAVERLSSTAIGEPIGHWSSNESTATSSAALVIIDPGWMRGGASQRGGVERRALQGSDPAGRQFRSRARITGPAWDHLPVTVALEFEDGVVLEDHWDGRAAWRGYEVVRAARLVEVRIDAPPVDVRPEDDGHRLEPDDAIVTDWAGWIGAVASFFASGVLSWP